MASNIKTIATTLVLIVVLTGCAQVRGERELTGVTTQQNTPTQDAITQDATAQTPVVGSVSEAPVFDFTATELFGQSQIDGTQLSDGPTILTFVVPDCVVCVSESQEIANSAFDNPDITYVVVHTAGATDKYEAFADNAGLYLENILHIDDTDGYLWNRFGVTQQPTTILVADTGKLSQSVGALELQGYENAIELVTNR